MTSSCRRGGTGVSEERGRLDAVDGLRAIAMTLVVAEHCKLAPFGWVGVWLFYVISGFVICRSFLLQPVVDPRRSYATFIRRRFYRIVPAYFFYIILNIIVMIAVGEFIDLRDVPFLLSFTYNWQMIFQIWPTPDGWSAFGHLWTLSVEEQFYIVFPVLFLCLTRRRFIAVAALLVGLGPAVRFLFSTAISNAVAAADPNWSAYAVYAASFTQFDAFLMGALLAFAEAWLRNARPWRYGLFLLALVAALAYGTSYVLANRALGAHGVDLIRNVFSGTLYGQGREAFVYSVVDLANISLVVLALTQTQLRRALSLRALSYVGRISYGGYLFHALILWLLGKLAMPVGFDGLPVLQRIPWFIIAWLVTIAVASCSFHWLESPIIAWARSRRPRSAARWLRPAGQPAGNEVGPSCTAIATSLSATSTDSGTSEVARSL